MKKNLVFIFFAAICYFLLVGCSEQKLIAKGNRIYAYVNNQAARDLGGNDSDRVVHFEVKKTFKTKIVPSSKDNIEFYYIALTESQVDSLVKNLTLALPVNKAISADPTNLGFNKKYYYPELTNTIDRSSFKYFDAKFGIQALTIPIKIRPALGNDSLYPRQAETSFNIGFAPGYKFNYNVFNPTRKFLGKTLATYSATPGIILGLGTAGLKKTVNAPELNTVDKTSMIFTYGGYLVFGVNNINLGFAVGWDNILGSDKKYWVYQGKMWYGIMISLDVIKF